MHTLLPVFPRKSAKKLSLNLTPICPLWESTVGWLPLLESKDSNLDYPYMKCITYKNWIYHTGLWKSWSRTITVMVMLLRELRESGSTSKWTNPHSLLLDSKDWFDWASFIVSTNLESCHSKQSLAIYSWKVRHEAQSPPLITRKLEKDTNRNCLQLAQNSNRSCCFSHME
jgi:hypothetical protein